MKRSILDVRLVDPAVQRDQLVHLHLDGAAVVGLDRSPSGFVADEVVDGQGLILCPAFTDLSCHLRDPGPSYKGNIHTESRAALAGGFTRVCVRADTQPPLDSAAVVQALLEKAETFARPRIFPVGALTQGLFGQLLSNMSALKAAGCVAVSNLRFPVQDNLVLRRCLEYAATVDLPVIFYPEDAALAAGGCAHEGLMASQLGLQGIPATAETLAISRDLLLVEQTGIRAHFSHLSAARSVELIAQAQARGLPVTADVAISHLLYTDAALQTFDSNFHLQPPLRSETDRQALLAGVREGVIGAISSGHLPHEHAAKMAPFPSSEPGMSSIETLLPQALELVAGNQLSLLQLVERLTAGPMALLGEHLAPLQPGSPAQDLVLIDPRIEWVYNAHSSHSAGQNSPCWNQLLKGQVRQLILAADHP